MEKRNTFFEIENWKSQSGRIIYTFAAFENLKSPKVNLNLVACGLK